MRKFLFLTLLFSGCQTITPQKQDSPIPVIKEDMKLNESPVIKEDEHKSENDFYYKKSETFQEQSIDPLKSQSFRQNLIQDPKLLLILNDLQLKKYDTVINSVLEYIEKVKKKNTIVEEEDLTERHLGEAYLILAYSYFERGDEDKAWPILNRLTYYGAKWSPIYYVLCEIYLKKEAYDLVNKVASKALDVLSDPSEDFDIYRARAFISLQNLDKAQSILHEKSKHLSKNGRLTGWMGVVELRRNQ